MKKKLNISVVDIVNRGTSPKNKKPILDHKPLNSPTNSVVFVDKPMRFQDLYKKAMSEPNRNGEHGCQKIVYESKKTTPINTNRTKKLSINRSTNNSKSRATSNANSTRKPVSSSGSQRINEPNKQNIRQNMMLTGITDNTFKQNKNHNIKISQLKEHSTTFQRCISELNHEEHSHLRERNDCFLSEREIDHIMAQLGYATNNKKYCDFLSLLQVDIYGGVPSSNLKQILQIIQESNFVSENCQKLKLPKVIDNNLKLILNEENEKIIYAYFRDFSLSGFQNGQQQKQNENWITQYKPPLSSIQNSFQLTKQKNYETYETEQKMQLLSPNKKVSNPAISELIQALSQSQKKKPSSKQIVKQQLDPNNRLVEQLQQQNMNTFRKVEASGFQQQGNNQYNFSRELSGDSFSEPKEDQDIVELKNRLNQALKKSSQEANQYFGKDRQYNSFVYSNPLKYGSKPILSVDVNLGDGISQKIIVYEGQSAKQVSQRLASKFMISEETKIKFEKMLQSHLSTMLWKIDQLSQQQRITDRDPQ